jgi:hypothetical protein
LLHFSLAAETEVFILMETERGERREVRERERESHATHKSSLESAKREKKKGKTNPKFKEINE